MWKSGHSAKPSNAYQFFLSLYSYRLTAMSIGTICLTIALFYSYLDGLYILDGPYDISGPKELYEREKVTIRVIAPHSFQELGKFVAHYSICPVVDRINVLWHPLTDFPKDESFKYTTTHSKVFFDKIEENTFWDKYLNFENIHTPGVFFVDSGTLLTCEHLSFVNSVWQSSYDTLVGVTPNLLQSSSPNQATLLSSNSVFWNKFYNLVHWDGVVVSKLYLQAMLESKDILRAMSSGQYCEDWFVNLYSIKLSKSPPLWVDVEALSSLSSSQKTSVSSLFSKWKGKTKQLNGECFSKLLDLLNISELELSYAKASPAKDFLIW